ncbi:hypothetical protein [Serratia quinivorans]|uniref:hypothetical protein n=1 Tax=Serratia quinivorans TaxID=137545 RepID=UPI00217BA36D|nr:hypothetical protein [Serratia quinivorans]CAI0915162.1 Uncharacterised protein [Serratia quinivorans]CAI1960728.1 Uncharacterised protein [Serratia quinivorans]
MPKTLKTAGDGRYLQKSEYLSEIQELGAAAQSSARESLGLGNAATKNVGVAGGNVMQVGAFGLGVGPVAKTNAYSNIAKFYRVNASSANAPPITGNIAAGVASLPCDAAPSTGYVAVSGNGAGFIGSSNTPANGVKWSRVYTTDYKPSAADVNAYSQLESDFRFILRSGDAIDYLDINKGLAVGLDTTVGRTL